MKSCLSEEGIDRMTRVTPCGSCVSGGKRPPARERAVSRKKRDAEWMAALRKKGNPGEGERNAAAKERAGTVERVDPDE
jgi:hypothetical protein